MEEKKQLENLNAAYETAVNEQDEKKAMLLGSILGASEEQVKADLEQAHKSDTSCSCCIKENQEVCEMLKAVLSSVLESKHKVNTVVLNVTFEDEKSGGLIGVRGSRLDILGGISAILASLNRKELLEKDLKLIDILSRAAFEGLETKDITKELKHSDD